MSDQYIGVATLGDNSDQVTVNPEPFSWRISMDNVRWVTPSDHGFVLSDCDDPDCIARHIHDE